MYVVQNMASEIFVQACHILKRTEACLVASQNIYYTVKKIEVYQNNRVQSSAAFWCRWLNFGRLAHRHIKGHIKG